MIEFHFLQELERKFKPQPQIRTAYQEGVLLLKNLCSQLLGLPIWVASVIVNNRSTIHDFERFLSPTLFVQ